MVTSSWQIPVRLSSPWLSHGGLTASNYLSSLTISGKVMPCQERLSVLSGPLLMWLGGVELSEVLLIKGSSIGLPSLSGLHVW